MIRFLLLSLLVACGGEAEQAATPPATPPVEAPAEGLPPQVARAVELAKAVESTPGDPTAALAAKNGSRAELEGLLYEIAADPALSDAYAKAMGR